MRIPPVIAAFVAMIAIGGIGVTVKVVGYLTRDTVPTTVDGRHEAYLGALERIDSSLVEQQSQALERGEYVCGDIERGMAEQTITCRAATRFGVPDAEAERIVAAARKYLCDPPKTSG